MGDQTLETAEINVVTGAYGYTGKYITRQLLAAGKRVRTLTGHPDRANPFGERVSAAPFNFDDLTALARSMEGATVLYNTYWIRFKYGDTTFDRAVENSKKLVRAAEAAGVQRMVHVSITNASVDSPLPYFRGKGLVEQAIQESRLSYAIIRPTVVFGIEDILINNIAWLLRRFPVFAVPGSGDYRLQPIFVEDMARVSAGAGEGVKDVVMDIVGPDVFTFNQLVQLIAHKVGRRVRLIHAPTHFALLLADLVGYVVNDVVLTSDEVEGLTANLLISDEPPLGHTRLGDWLETHADQVGTRYASELERHYR
jgi:NADH dehydrogenase